MLAVSISAVSREQRDDDLRSKRPDDRHDILEQGVARPCGPHGRIILGVTEVVGAREILVRLVPLPFGENFGGAHHPEQHLALSPIHVDAVFAARERQVRRLDMAAEREPGNERVVFVVWVRADDQHSRGGPDACGLLSPV